MLSGTRSAGPPSNEPARLGGRCRAGLGRDRLNVPESRRRPSGAGLLDRALSLPRAPRLSPRGRGFVLPEEEEKDLHPKSLPRQGNLNNVSLLTRTRVRVPGPPIARYSSPRAPPERRGISPTPTPQGARPPRVAASPIPRSGAGSGP